MINAESYISDLIGLLQLQFGSRLLYVGLQGSYLRGEATDTSDIDVMVIIDALSITDLMQYRRIIQTLQSFDKSCGFICSKQDIEKWNPLEMCHLVHTTKDCYGVLRDFVSNYSQEDIRNFVKISLNNLYHEICHRFVHAQDNANISKLTGSYKCVFFILQNLHYLNSGRFIATKAELLSVLDAYNRKILIRAMELDRGVTHEFYDSFALLFDWCQYILQSV